MRRRGRSEPNSAVFEDVARTQSLARYVEDVRGEITHHPPPFRSILAGSHECRRFGRSRRRLGDDEWSQRFESTQSASGAMRRYTSTWIDWSWEADPTCGVEACASSQSRIQSSSPRFVQWQGESRPGTAWQSDSFVPRRCDDGDDDARQQATAAHTKGEGKVWAPRECDSSSPPLLLVLLLLAR